MQKANKSKEEKTNNCLEKMESIFAGKGKEIVRNGMQIILDRMRFAKKYDEKIREAICAIEYESEQKPAQVKTLVDVLRKSVLADTNDILSLVNSVLEKQKTPYVAEQKVADKVVVMLDDEVRKWAK